MDCIKYQNISYLLIFISSFLTGGCIRDDRPKEYTRNEQSSFYVADLKAETQPQVTSQYWGLPQAHNVKLQAKIELKGPRTQVGKGIEFWVHTETHRFLVTSREDGTLEWTERIPFAFFAERPRYLVFERTIEGPDIYAGKVKVNFAFNPWTDSRDQDHPIFVFLRSKDLLASDVIASGANRIQLQSEEVIHDLLIRDVSVNIRQVRPRSQGWYLNMALKFTPYTRMKKIDGHRELNYDFEQGRFDVYTQIINTGLGNGDKAAKLTPTLHQADIAMQNGEFQVRFEDFPLLYDSPQGSLILAIKVVPVGQPSLEPFRGLYHFTSLRSGADFHWIGRQNLEREIENYINQTQAYRELLAKAYENPIDKKLNIHERPTYRWGDLSIRYNSIRPDETATSRTILFNNRICAVDSVQGQVAAYQEFRIHTYAGDIIEGEAGTTDDAGCLRWTDEISHSYYQPERYHVRNIKFEHKESGAITERRVAINPWDLFATFGKDERQENFEAMLENHKNDLLANPDKVDSRINIAEFWYNTIQFDYHVEDDLSLNVLKKILFRVHPEVTRYNSMTRGRQSVEPIRDGIWLLKVAIQKDYLDPAQKGVTIQRDDKGRTRFTAPPGHDPRLREHISYQEKFVRVINGRIITPIEFSMQDLRLMRIRSNMLIQLEPINERLLLFSDLFGEFLDDNSEIISEIRSDRENLSPDERYVQLVGRAISEQNGDKYIQPVIDSYELQRKRKYFYKRMQLVDGVIKSIDRGALNAALGATLSLRPQNEAPLGIIEDIFREAIKESISPGLQRNCNMTPGARIPLYCQIPDIQITPTTLSETFVKNLNENFKLTEKMLERLRINDFMTESLAAHGTPDYFVIPVDESGLERKTFIGPLTFLLNSNRSEVRSTETLDENHCITPTCHHDHPLDSDFLTWLENEDPDNDWRRFYGSVAHFKDKHVDDLIKKKNHRSNAFDIHFGPNNSSVYGLNEFEERQKAASRLRSNFLNLHDYEYVSMSNEPPVKVDPDCRFPVFDKSCLVPDPSRWIPTGIFIEKLDQTNRDPSQRDWGGPPDANNWTGNWSPDQRLNFLSFFSEQTAESQTSWNDLRSTLYRNPERKGNNGLWPTRTEITLTGPMAEKFCAYFANIVTEKVGSLLKLTDLETPRWHHRFLKQCITDNARGREAFIGENTLPLQIEQRLIVNKVGESRFKGGKAFNINVGSQIGIQRREGLGRMLKFDYLNPVGKIPVIGAIVGGLGYSVSRDANVTSADGTAIHAATWMVAQTATLDIQLKEYERCVVFKWHPMSIPTFGQRQMRRQGVSLKDMADALGHGVMLCAGRPDVEDYIMPIRERYYYFAQHFTEGEVLDTGDLYNHPWLLRLRGSRDFNAFMATLYYRNQRSLDDMFTLKEVKPYFRETFPYLETKAFKPVVDSYSYPVKQLVDAYRQVLPTFNGMYAPLQTEPAGFPWNSPPDDSFDEYGQGLGPYREVPF